MSDNSGSDWLSVAWEVIKYALAGMGAIASSAFIWVSSRYKGDRSMLLNHERRLNENDAELGKLTALRHIIAKGPIGEEIEAGFRSVDDQLEQLRESDVVIRLAITEKNGDIKEIKEALSWIKDAIRGMK